MSLKDELLKANLISKKEASRIEHEKRVERKKLGTTAVKEQEQERQKSLEQKMEAKRQHDKELAKQQSQEKQEKEKNMRLEELIQTSIMEERGNRRFFFVTKSNKISSLSVGENLSEKLEKGLAAILEINTPEGPDFCIVNRPCAEQVLENDAKMVLFFNH